MAKNINDNPKSNPSTLRQAQGSAAQGPIGNCFLFVKKDLLQIGPADFAKFANQFSSEFIFVPEKEFPLRKFLV